MWRRLAGLTFDLRMTRLHAKSSWHLISLGIVMIALSAGAMSGQSAPAGGPGPWQVGAFGGWYVGGKLYTYKGAVRDDVRLGDSPTYGLRLGYEATSWLGLEVSWERARPDVTFATSARATIGQVPLNTYLLSSNLYFTRAPIRGFLSIGVGGAYISPYVPGAPSGDTNFTASLGVGMKAFFDRHIALRFDAGWRETYVNVSPRLPVFCEQASNCYYYKRNWYPSYQMSGGLLYAF